MKNLHTDKEGIPASGAKLLCFMDDIMHTLRKDDRLKKAVLESSKKRARNKSERLKKQMEIQHEAVIDYHLFEKAQATMARRQGKRSISITIYSKGADKNERS